MQQTFKTLRRETIHMSFLKALLVRIAVGLFGLAVALLSAEFVFRMATPLWTTHDWTDRPSFFYKPRQARTMQGNSYTKSKPEGTFRIAVLGDSFAFATDMQFDDAFPKKLERMLNVNGAATRAEVINYAVPGYSTNHQAAQMPEVLSASPDLVLLQITLNDPQLKPPPTGITGKNVFGALDPGQQLQGIFAHWRSLGFVANRLHNSRTQTNYINYYFSLFEREPEWNSFRNALKRIAKACERGNTPLVATVFPLFGLPLDHKYPFLPLHKRVVAELDQLQVPNLDLFNTYAGIPLDRIQLIPRKDFHPNEIGHRMAAEEIFLWLQGQNLLPPELVIKDRFRQRLNIKPRHNDRI